MLSVRFRTVFAMSLVSGLLAMSARADDQYIVRVNGGLPVIQLTCRLLGCHAGGTLDGSLGRVFLVTASNGVPAATFLASLVRQIGVVDAELDLTATVADSGAVPAALLDSTPVEYFGATVPHGYVNQPASQILRLADTQSAFQVRGAGTVAVIDTGIDPSHPALSGVLVPGYDFTRNQSGEGDETLDVLLVQRPAGEQAQPFWVSPNKAAMVTQSTAAVVDGNPEYSDFGHGTMVAGIIHLVAPGASLMPLKAFSSDGTGKTSNILRAIYWAVQNNANIINMSFNLASYSQEIKNAIDYASLRGVVCVAAAGNQGQDILVYPAALRNVISVASTTNDDQRSTFSNYGQDLVWVAAPGEGVVTTYPFSTYAAAWGTSFSTPFVSGVAALMFDSGGSLLMRLLVSGNQSDSAQSVANAKPISADLGKGRLDPFQALIAWRKIVGHW